VRENLTATLAISTAGQAKQTELVARLEDRFAESSSVPNDVTFASRLRLLRDKDRADLCRRDPIGINARLTSLQAELGLVQVTQIGELIRQRIRHAFYLSSLLIGARRPTVVPGYRHAFHRYTIRVNSGREMLARRLRNAGIEAKINVPRPIYAQPLYRSFGFQDRLPNTERACIEVLSLPIDPMLTRVNLAVVGECVNSIIARLAPRSTVIAVPCRNGKL
jgi:dTDP-4-amino-4,6-dideoxygalactose transaminase